MFRSLIFGACIIGAAVGLILTFIQAVSISPIIFEAEKFESKSSAIEVLNHINHHGSDTKHSHSVDGHGAEWAPEDGAERLFYTGLANIFVCIGFSSLLLSFMSIAQNFGSKKNLSYIDGLLWGGCAFLAVFVAPSIMLPPELPGMKAEELSFRQLWWFFFVLAAVSLMAIVFFAPLKFKGLSLLVAVPYMVFPGHSIETAVGSDASALNDLYRQFLLASSFVNFVSWIATGMLCVFVLNWMSKNRVNNAQSET